MLRTMRIGNARIGGFIVLEYTKYIFSDLATFLKFLIVLWMICPWLHVRRKVHIFGRQTQKPVKKAEQPDERIKATL